MKSAKKHNFESERIKSLKELNILDTLPEKDFDDIATIASIICDTPIALISLVDENRQWFKSKIGLTAQETPRDIAFCAHAILQNDLFLVSDASKDERFFDNPLVVNGPQIKFYAGAPLLSPEGLPIGTVCVIDSKPKTLSENQKNALKALSNQVTRLLELKSDFQIEKKMNSRLAFKKTAMENITEGVVLQNQTGAIIDFNNAALKVLGLSADQLTGKTSMDPDWKAIKSDESDFPGDQHPAMVCLRTGEPQKDIIMGVRTTDEVRWIRINSVPLYLDSDKNNRHAVTSFSDITDIKKLENERRKYEAKLSANAKLSTLGEMASGLAHEINNPLTIIQSKTRFLRKKLEAGLLSIENEKDFTVIEKTVDRIAKIIKGLRTYSRDAGNDPFEKVQLLSIINDTLELCREKFYIQSAKIDINCDSNITIECRAAQVSQILMNLFSNSYDAIQELNNKWIKINVELQDQYVNIHFTDSGNGIPEKVVQRLMEPFFTTKGVGKGTGLGLSISKGIAESHSGQLTYLLENKNTTFLIKLPLHQNSKFEKAS